MVLTMGPRWGTVLTSPSASSNRSASRIEGRLTPIISHNSRSTSRCPGVRLPDMMAARSFCATIARTVGTSSIWSVDFSSVRRRRSIGGVPSIFGYVNDLPVESAFPQFQYEAVVPGSPPYSCDRPSAVDRQGGSGDVLPRRAAKEGGHGADALRRNKPPARLTRRQIFPRSGIHGLAVFSG